MRDMREGDEDFPHNNIRSSSFMGHVWCGYGKE